MRYFLLTIVVVGMKTVLIALGLFLAFLWVWLKPSECRDPVGRPSLTRYFLGGLVGTIGISTAAPMLTMEEFSIWECVCWGIGSFIVIFAGICLQGRRWFRQWWTGRYLPLDVIKKVEPNLIKYIKYAYFPKGIRLRSVSLDYNAEMEKCEGIAEVEWKGEKHKINLDIAVGAEDFEWHARSDTDSQELNRIIKNPSTLTPGKVQAGDSKYWGTYRAEDIDGRSMEISLLQKGAVKFSEGGESIDGQGKWFTVMDSLFLKGPGGLDMILTINPDGSLRLVEVEVESGVWEDSWDYEALLKKI